jgi:hypothetical protein
MPTLAASDFILKQQQRRSAGWWPPTHGTVVVARPGRSDDRAARDLAVRMTTAPVNFPLPTGAGVMGCQELVWIGCEAVTCMVQTHNTCYHTRPTVAIAPNQLSQSFYHRKCAHTHSSNWFIIFVITDSWYELQFGFFIGAQPTHS